MRYLTKVLIIFNEKLFFYFILNFIFSNQSNDFEMRGPKNFLSAKIYNSMLCRELYEWENWFVCQWDYKSYEKQKIKTHIIFG